ncbi:response regulator [Legionella pneumophila]|uniref:Response regulator, receiver domain n=1 Tax=Legionella pneumophila subsp. pascullei TaxID=91890 RepID=A0AAX2IZW7_LEGPN|nr:response regulator [Legionella pneumophila]AMP89071.1 response regulator [Legionella pneumophila subsp. pascullei]AMP93262.1 hypothetical protein AXF36_11825 [Legionella pneumophila subsp. pascullei]AMP96228.1 hypothetical protein AXF37_11715 [Legionella pneumophila subsp. pascullei]SQG91179.1 response regulator, receiver domain [Legionella pneumophila subsp. pascullei]VEH07725.1 response regulator, receiver domain [Legionella pneumophila subsp. pascullei]
MVTKVDILYIEDDEADIIAMQREFLKTKKPINIVIAKDGEQGLDMLYGLNGQLKINPRVILLDLNLPKMNGLDFLKKLRKDFNFINVKVFLLTGAYNTEEKLASIDLDTSGCIIKPLQHEDALNIFWCATSGENMSKLLFMQ